MRLFKISIVHTLIPSIFFNLWYFPLKIAIKLPILLYKPHFNCLRGKITIQSNKIYPGMIRLGFLQGNCYPNSGITWYNKGHIIFKGPCAIGNNSHIVVMPTGYVEFGNHFHATTTFKLHSSYAIIFNESVSFGWDNTIMDSNLHPICDKEKKEYTKSYGKIEFGAYNWITTQCLILHNVSTPSHCIFAAKSVITQKNFEPYTLWGGVPLRIIRQEVMRDFENDVINYASFNK